MKIYRLAEDNRKKASRDQILEIDGNRYLVSPGSVCKVENTVIIESPGIDSRIVMEFRYNAESDNPNLEDFQVKWIDVEDTIYLFWYSEISYARMFGDQYQVEESKLW